MRDIEFRAKLLSNNKWVFGTPFSAPQFTDYVYIIQSDAMYPVTKNLQSIVTIDPSTLGQYTGCVDKYGVKIYEHDIIKGKFHFGAGYRVRTGVVEYHVDGFKVKVDGEYKNIPLERKVIGNVFENYSLKN